MSALSALRSLSLRDTLEINLLGLTSIPMLAFITPRVMQNDGNTTRVRIPLNFRTRNHLGSMYFGVLCAGADVVSGIPVVRLMRERRQSLSLVFKDLKADFLKRPDGDVEFRTDDIGDVEEAFHKALRTGERVNTPIRSVAYVVGREHDPVAKFTLTLSLRLKKDEKLPLVQRLLSRI